MHGGAPAHAAAVARATLASGTIVKMEPEDFLAILRCQPEPLVVHACGGLFRAKHRYLTSHRGLAFFTQSAEPVSLPGKCELVEARRIWIPG